MSFFGSVALSTISKSVYGIYLFLTGALVTSPQSRWLKLVDVTPVLSGNVTYWDDESPPAIVFP